MSATRKLPTLQSAHTSAPKTTNSSINWIDPGRAYETWGNFADLVHKVAYGDEEYVVEKYGKPLVKVTRVTEEKGAKKKMSAGEFLRRLADENGFTAGPKDLANNVDHYLYGAEYRQQSLY